MITLEEKLGMSVMEWMIKKIQSSRKAKVVSGLLFGVVFNPIVWAAVTAYMG